MLAKCRLSALIFIVLGFAASACSLITDVDRSKIPGSGGVPGGGSTAYDAGGGAPGAGGANGGSTSQDAADETDAANDAGDAA
jgi:hypothetical protein